MSYTGKMQPYEGKEPYIFVSYSHRDANEVLPIVDQLTDLGFRIWYDDGIVPGSEWPEYIAQHLKKSSVVLTFITPNYIESNNCKRELTYAQTHNRKITAVVLRQTKLPAGMELQLSAQRNIFRANYTAEKFLQEICNADGMEDCKNNDIAEPEPIMPGKSKRIINPVIIGCVAALIIIVCIALVAISNKQAKTTSVTPNSTEISKSSADNTPASDASPTEASVDIDSSPAVIYEEPTNEPSVAPTVEPENEEVSVVSEDSSLELNNAKVGDIITFGTYEQDNNTKNGAENIEWIILDNTEEEILLISRYALDARKFHSSYNNVSWESCSLRTWLNGTFYTTAFSNEERELISGTNITADSDEEDYVFLLSAEDVEKYFSSNSMRECTPTAYAAARGAFKSTKSGIEGNTVWWLRNAGYINSNAVSVNTDGTIYYSGDPVNRDENSVRPAIWIKI